MGFNIYGRIKEKLVPGAVLAMMFCAQTMNAQLTVVGNQTAAQLANTLTGEGVIVTNPVLTCAGNANGHFAGVSNLGIDSGIVLTSGQAETTPAFQGVNGPAGAPSRGNNTPGDPQLTDLAGQPTYDACVLEFDFQPAGDTVKFNYVFGSVEYTSYSCSQYNDAFGFFISGPNIPGVQNLAKVPGTNIAVTVNSTTDPVVNNVTDLTLCTAMGPGSPFSQYYIDNTGGATVTYLGFTKVFQAVSAVTPCTTYHLKLAIADAGDPSLDSGVFLEAGSLTSGSAAVDAEGVPGAALPTPYCVRECYPGKFIFTRPAKLPIQKVIHYTIAGTAQNGIDYQQIPDSVVIPAGDSFVVENIYGLAANPATGPRSVILYILSPYVCNGNNIIDTAEITILDSIYVNVLTPDTAICIGQNVFINAIGDSVLDFTWTPGGTLDRADTLTPTATPTTTTTYYLTGILPGSGCPSRHVPITITVLYPPTVNLGPDLTSCVGVPIQLNAGTNITPANQTYTYQWHAGTYLNDSNIVNPVSTPTDLVDVTYYVIANPGAPGCDGRDTIVIHELPNDFELGNHDTTICKGATVQINAAGNVNFTYIWTPTNGMTNPNIINPAVTPDTTTYYTIKATYPGCPDMYHSFTVNVEPLPTVILPDALQMCQWDTLYMSANIIPPYSGYLYDWSPTAGLANYDGAIAMFTGDNSATYVLTVSTPIGCKGSDSTAITVFPGNFATLTPGVDTNLCPRDTVQLHATGGVLYNWTPKTSDMINDPVSSDPIVYPFVSTHYNVLVTDEHGCRDTLGLSMFVHSGSVFSMPDSVRLYPGESYQMHPDGNALYYNWFPANGLNATNISNPIAQPEVSTQYVVTGTTEWGCSFVDSIQVIVDGESVLDIPNAFSPGSNPNSEFKIVKRGIATLKNFRIFNRWGTMVFETTDIDKGWDGRYKGTPQPMGVYVYMVEAYTSTGKKFIKQGNVTLIR